MWSDYESGMWEVREVQPHIVKRERGTFSWVVRGDLVGGDFGIGLKFRR